LRRAVGETLYQLERRVPCEALAPFVEMFWMVHWELPEDAPYLQENIPDPSTHLTVDREGGHVYGLTKGRFSYWLTGTGSVFGIKFHPGALFPFLGRPVAELMDQNVSIEDVFGASAQTLVKEIQQLPPDAHNERVACGTAFLVERLPEPDPQVTRVRELVASIREHKEMMSVDELVKHAHCSKRSLQRLFRTYVGVNPKWLVRLFRLQDVVASIETGDVIDWADLAASLGYFDQSHLIRDFKQVVGMTPALYQKKCNGKTND
jgi:AraC-like DNA-binding protein